MGRGQGKVLFASRTPMGSDNVRTWLAMYPARSMQCMPLFPWTTASDAARNPQESTVQRACTRRAIPCGLAGREQSRCVRTSSLHTTVQDAKSKCLLCRGDPGARVASGWQRAAGSGQRAAGSGQRAAGSGQRAGDFAAGTPVASGSDLAPNLPWPESSDKERRGEQMAHIVVVDDDPGIRTALRSALEEQGHAVSEAGDGLTALERLHTSPWPLVVLLDLKMPYLDGAGCSACLQATARSRSATATC